MHGIKHKPASRKHVYLIVISTKAVTLVKAVMQKWIEFSAENKMQIISLKRHPLETQGFALGLWKHTFLALRTPSYRIKKCGVFWMFKPTSPVTTEQ